MGACVGGLELGRQYSFNGGLNKYPGLPGNTLLAPRGSRKGNAIIETVQAAFLISKKEYELLFWKSASDWP